MQQPPAGAACRQIMRKRGSASKRLALQMTITKATHHIGLLTESPVREKRTMESRPLMFMNKLTCRHGSIMSDLPMGPGTSDYLNHAR